MLNNPEAAECVSDELLEINVRLNESIQRIQGQCSPKEFSAYQKRVGVLINSIFEQILEPIYAKDPALRPPHWEL